MDYIFSRENKPFKLVLLVAGRVEIRGDIFVRVPPAFLPPLWWMKYCRGDGMHNWRSTNLKTTSHVGLTIFKVSPWKLGWRRRWSCRLFTSAGLRWPRSKPCSVRAHHIFPENEFPKQWRQDFFLEGCWHCGGSWFTLKFSVQKTQRKSNDTNAPSSLLTDTWEVGRRL